MLRVSLLTASVFVVSCTAPEVDPLPFKQASATETPDARLSAEPCRYTTLPRLLPESRNSQPLSFKPSLSKVMSVAPAGRGIVRARFDG